VPAEAPELDEDLDAKAIPMEECAFAEFDLHVDLLRAVAQSGYRTPSPIQARTLPFALEGRDIIGQAKTGTGKTAAYLVPALQTLSKRPGIRVAVIVPTRELAVQVTGEATRLGRYLGVHALAIYGGDSMSRQLQALKAGAQVIAATPGRLLDHMGRGTVKLDHLDVLVLDEADRMFDLGFRDDIARILARAPGRRQTMLFSATLGDEVLALAEKHMSDPARIFLAPDKMTVEEVRQTFFAVERERKTALLLKVLERESPERSIIFTRTKHGADKLAEKLQQKGVAAQEIHSGLPQKKRERILQGFRDGVFTFLIATDVAARGLDIDDVSHVINFDIPENPEDYVHRIGRTARMGKEGRAATFVTPDDGEFLTAIEKLINQEIAFESYDDFEPAARPNAAPAKPEPPKYVRTLQGFIRPRGRR
jgi:ATP-dependent RNA helicase DeaD